MYALKTFTPDADIEQDTPRAEVVLDWPAMRRHLTQLGIVADGDHQVGPIRAAQQCADAGSIDGVRYVLDCDWTDPNDRTEPCGCRLQRVTAGMDSGEGWEVYEPCGDHGGDPERSIDEMVTALHLAAGIISAYLEAATRGRYLSTDSHTAIRARDLVARYAPEFLAQ